MHAQPLHTRAELEELFLEYALRALRDNNQCVILLAGESGYGKTTLLEQWCDAVRSSATVAFVQCLSPIGSQHVPLYQPLYPFVKAIEHVLAGSPEKAKRRLIVNIGLSVLGMIPLIGSIFDITKEVLRDMREFRRETSPQQQYETHQMAESIRAIAREQPLVLLIDDAQWMDAASVEVLEYLAATPERVPLVLVVAYERSLVQAQNTALASWLTQWASSALELELQPLTPAELRQIVAAHLPAYRPSAAFDEWLLARSGGIPAIVMAYMHYFQHHPPFTPEGALRQEVLQNAYTPAAQHVLIEQMLGALATDDKLTLAICAAEGMSFSVFVVAHLLQRDPISTVRLLRSLHERTGVIRSLGMQRLYGVETTVYTFTSNAYYHYFCEYLEHEERIELHSRIAAILQQQAVACDDEALRRQLTPLIAAHYAEAGNHDAAKDVLSKLRYEAEEAGHSLLASYAAKAVEDTYSGEAKLSSDSGYLLKELVELWHEGKFVQAYQRAEQVVVDGATAQEQHLLELVRVRLEMDCGYRQRAHERLARVLSDVDSWSNTEIAALAHAMAVVVHSDQMHLHGSWEHAQKSAAIAQHLSPQTKLVALANLALVFRRFGLPQWRLARKVTRQLAHMLNYHSIADELA